MAAAAQRQFALVHVEPVVIAGVRIDQIDDRIVDAALFRFEASHAIEPIAGMPIEPSRFHRSSPRRNVPPWYAPATPFPGAGPVADAAHSAASRISTVSGSAATKSPNDTSRCTGIRPHSLR